MKSLVFLIFAALTFVVPIVAASLTLERTLSLPGVEGRIDHFTLDAAGNRLFVAALGNNTVEVVSLTSGEVVHSITGLTEPQGLFFLGEMNRLYVANSGDGSLRVFNGKTYSAEASVKFDDDADNVRYDEVEKRLYVGQGSGALGVLDVVTNVIVASIPLRAHPESFQLEKKGPRVFVNVPSAHHIAVIDRRKQTLIATWSLGFAAGNFPMALDESNHRLMIGCRLPARLIVFDTKSGKEIAKVDLHGDCDDLFFDANRRQIYASCGEGFVDVFRQTDADHYALKEAIKTESKARTCFYDGERLYVAVPKRGDRSAHVLCYRIEK